MDDVTQWPTGRLLSTAARLLVLRTEAGSEVLATIADATAHDELLPGHRLAQPDALRAELVAIVERLGRERWGQDSS